MRNCRVLLIIASVLIFGCDNTDEALTNEAFRELDGTWLMTERGWSPGSGYNIDPVPPVPAQTITFSSPKTFRSNIQGFTDFKYYILLTDTTEVAKLHLYVDDPDSELGKPNFEQFFLEFKNGTLKVMQMGCIEGCHLGFRKEGLDRE